ncbi:nickel-responsive transcriptional regulator NikR [Nitrosomonas sp.]|uniref:nickel-responsive transcriptional regulator NikR n=1 Tax=Nitrosomonas sp. TaxID=42353 RepID=UPI002084BD17|nr:nickel-responsive transcriptional regulator NikR [Nitrosomonas sp.]GJL75643.1 MAG: nickel-responsive regulator [Nitrosomonas sp.]
MNRFTISLDNQLSAQFDKLMRSRGYTNRSEAVRDMIRKLLETEHLKNESDGDCVASLSYIYNHHESDLANRITAVHHNHHNLTLSSMHVHMDHFNCLEVVFLRGSIQDVTDFANQVIATRGVRHGKLFMVPVEIKQEQHLHEPSSHTHSNPLI